MRKDPTADKAIANILREERREERRGSSRRKRTHAPAADTSVAAALVNAKVLIESLERL